MGEILIQLCSIVCVLNEIFDTESKEAGGNTGIPV